jgi:hypothetical protein
MMVIPELNKLKHTLLIRQNWEANCLPTLKEDLIASIDRRWPKYEANNLYAVATTVDPLYKDCGFSDASFAAIALTMVLREMVTLNERLSLSTESSQPISNSSTCLQNSGMPINICCRIFVLILILQY